MSEKSINVCLIAPIPPPYGGIGNWVLLLKKYVQSRDDIKLDIINTSPKVRGIDGRNLWERVVSQGFDMLNKIRKLKKLIDTNCPDVIHITTSGQLAIVRDIFLLRFAKKKKVKTVYHIHFGRIKAIAESDSVEWKLISKAIKLSTTTMTIDSATYKAISEYIPNSNVVCVPNPIDHLNLPSHDICSNEKRTVMFLGWVVATKGIEELITVWNKIYQKYNDWELNIVGPCKDNYFTHLKKNYSLDGIVFLGEKSHIDAMKILSSASVFVLPSYTEGFPNVLLEAMIFSKPIIATNVGAIPDMLADNCGILIPPKNTDSLEKALDLFICDSTLREFVGRNGSNKARKLYDINVVFEQYKHYWRF